MNDLDGALREQAPIEPGRRRLLAGFLGAYTASLIPWALAEPVADPGHGAFVALSALLCGRAEFNAAQAARLYGALSADAPGFSAAVQTLLALINDRKIDPLQLQTVLDAENSALAGLPRTLLTAWFVGIVGTGDRARCLTYETSLMSVVVVDHLKPPTYAYGSYGSWSAKPL